MKELRPAGNAEFPEHLAQVIVDGAGSSDNAVFRVKPNPVNS
jgi:hypothetical protein